MTNGLRKMESVGKQRTFLARGPVKKSRLPAMAKRPLRAKGVVQKIMKAAEVDLDELEDESESTWQPDKTREGV